MDVEFHASKQSIRAIALWPDLFTIQYIDQQKYVWKTGILLNKDNTKAEVIEDYGKREIRIRVVGNKKRDFLDILILKQ